MVAPRPSVADDDLEARLLNARLDRARQARQGIRGQTGYRPLVPTTDQSTLGGTGAQFVYGANSRLADVWSAPMRLAEAAVSPIFEFLPEGSGASQQHVSTPVEDFLREGESVAPQGGMERVAHRVGEEVGAAVPLMGLPYVAAAALPAARPAQSVARAVVDHFLGGVRSTPAAALAGETVAATGGGAGAGVANEIAPGSLSAEIAGQLAGSFAPMAMPSALSYRLGRSTWDRFLSPAAATSRARDQVAKTLGEEIGPDGMTSLETAEQLRSDIPGFNPSLAEATSSPALVATQRQIGQGASGRELEHLARRRQQNLSAVQRFAQERAPAGSGGPEFVIDTTMGRINSLTNRLSGKAAEVEAQRTALADTIGDVPRRQTGEALRSGLESARRTVSQQMTAMADQLGLNRASVTVPFARAKEELLATFGQKSVFEDLKNYPEVLKAIEAAPDEVSFMDLKALRERIGDDIVDAMASPFGRTKKVRVLRAMQQSVDNLLDTLVSAQDPELASNYRAFRSAYREQFIDRFEHGIPLKVRARDGSGYYKMPDEEIAAEFFTPGRGGVTAAQQFKKVFRGNAEMTASLEGYAADSLRDAAIRDGALNPQAFATWVRRHAEVIAEFPSIGRMTSNLQRGQEWIASRQATLAARQRAVEDQVLTRELRRFEAGSRTAEQVIGNAIQDPRKMEQFASRLRTEPEAWAALRRHVWDKAVDLDAAGLENFLSRNRDSLLILFADDHLDNLHTIANARKMIETVPAPQGRGYMPTPLEGVENKLGMGLPQIASRLFAVESGRTSWRYAGTEGFGRYFRNMTKQQYETLMRQALFDPAVARDLASISGVRRVPQEVAHRLNVRLLNLGLTNRESEEE